MKAEALEPDLLIDALKHGRYYSSQGPEIIDISVAGDEVRIECSPAAAIAIVGRGSRSQSTQGSGLTDAVFPLRRFLGSYFRATVTDAQGRKAWSNPIWLDEQNSD